VAAVTRYVNTASSGGDGTTNATSGGTAAYASLSSFDANYSASATDDLTVECCGGSDTLAFDYDLATTPNSTLIRANPSEPDGLYTGDDAISTAHYYLNRGTSTAFAVKIREPNTTLQNIQIVHASTGAFDNAVSLANGSHVGVVFDSCSIRAAGAGCFGYGGSDPGTLGGTLTIRNCLLVLTAGTAAINLDTASAQSLAVQFDIYQNTIYSNGAKPGVRVTTDWNGTNAQTFNIKNNVVANTTDPFSLQADSGNRVTNTDYNWTDAGTDGTTNEQNLPASPFTSAGSTNGSQFTLTEALATGAAVGSITTDKQGTTRGTPPDAGAYEFATASTTATTTLDAAIQRQITVATALNAAVQTSNTATAEVGAAIQEARTVATTLDATVQQTRTALVTLDAALLQARTALVTMDAAVQASLTASTTLDAFIQAGFQVQAFVDAAIQQNRTAITSLDAGIQTTRTVTTAIDAAILASLAVTATIDAVIRFTGTATTTIDAAIQQARTAAATIDAVVALALNVTTSLDAAIQSARTAMAWLDAYIDDPEAVPPVGRNFNVSGRGRFTVPARGGFTVH
jgi:hypothetical protein